MAPRPPTNNPRGGTSGGGGGGGGGPKGKPAGKGHGTNTSGSDAKSRKRNRVFEARQIAHQTSGRAFGNGELDLQKFIRAREFEIGAVQDGLRQARKMLSTRAFQEVPRDMRRRTASHDVKRVPKRLRDRAKREMHEDGGGGAAAAVKKRRKVDARKRLREQISRMKKRDRMEEIKRKRKGKAEAETEAEGDGDVTMAEGQAEPVGGVDNPDGMVVDGLEPTEPSAESRAKATPTSAPTKPKPKPGSAPKPAKAPLSHPPLPPAKFRKRQKHKTWLPTHLFHAKRARMTDPASPLWGFALPLTPSAKSYRYTHRAIGSGRLDRDTDRAGGAIGWDASYMSTLSIAGLEKDVWDLLSTIGVDLARGSYSGLMELPDQTARWMDGKRAWEGWAFESRFRPSVEQAKRPLAPVVVFWRPLGEGESETGNTDGRDESAGKETKKQGTKPDLPVTSTPARQLPGKFRLPALGMRHREALIRVHPSAFPRLWDRVTSLAAASKPPVSVRDARYEIGSIEITGPGAIEALTRVLKPWVPDGAPGSATRMGELWRQVGVWSSAYAAAPVAENGVAPELYTRVYGAVKNTVFGFDAVDPRLHVPARVPRPPQTDTDGAAEGVVPNTAAWQTLCDDLCSCAPTTGGIFDLQARRAAVKTLLPQKKIDRRRAGAMPGKEVPLLPTDSRIPVLVYRTLDTGDQKGGSSGPNGGMWTVLMPWKFVDPVWRCLMQLRLSPVLTVRPDGTRTARSGQLVRFGGVEERRQFCFEMERPWFPGDVPGTDAGDAWAVRDRIDREDEWRRRPRGKRAEWDSLDLGNGEERGEIGTGWACDWDVFVAEAVEGDRRTGYQRPPPLIQHVCHFEAKMNIDSIRFPPSKDEVPELGLATVRLRFVGRGVPGPTDRIYRLPTDGALRARWLRLCRPTNRGDEPYRDAEGEGKGKGKDGDGEDGLSSSALPRPPARFVQPGDEDYPPVPGRADLVGFVTSGNYNLREGFGTGIGSVVLRKVMHPHGRCSLGLNPKNRDNYCIVRPAGQKVGRLAKWEPVSSVG